MSASKYVVKGINSSSDVVISFVCVVTDLPYILDTVKSFDNVENVRVTYLDPDYKSEV